MRVRDLERSETETNGNRGVESVWRALELLGDRWTFLVLCEAFSGVTRYGIFQRNLGIARNVLASRLATLVESGLLKRVRYRTDPDWYEYRLTKAGFELFPELIALQAWSQKHLVTDEAEAARGIHRHTCGRRLRPLVVCAACGEAVSAADVQYEVVPALVESAASEEGSELAATPDPDGSSPSALEAALNAR